MLNMLSSSFEVSKHTNIRFGAFCLVGKQAVALIFNVYDHWIVQRYAVADSSTGTLTASSEISGF